MFCFLIIVIMHVVKLELLNIRSYPSASVTFSKGINLILGPNNSGKSTILRSLQKLQVGLAGITSEDVRKTKEFGKIHIKLDGITSKEISLFQPKSGSMLVGKQQDILFSFRNKSGHDKKEEFLQVTGGKMNIGLENGDIKTELLPLGEASENDFAQFPQFPFMENENNFIYPFLAKRKTSHYTSQGGSQAAYGITEQLSNLPSRIQNLINNTHSYNEEYNKQAKDILGFTVCTGSSKRPRDLQKTLRDVF
jgi:AAA15 family ATPase/GTPase